MHGTKKGYEGLKLTTLRKLSSYFNTTLDYWFIDDITDPNYGKSNGFKIDFEEMEHIKKYRQLDDYGKETIKITLDREIARSLEIQEMDAKIKELEQHPATVITLDGNSGVVLRSIQYFHKVSAGTGELIYEDSFEECVEIPDVPKYRRAAYAVKVSGNSMEPLYHDGDILLIESTKTIEIGEIGIFNVSGNAFVKKRGESELISLNPEYSNIPFTQDTYCMGRVIDKL